MIHHHVRSQSKPHYKGFFSTTYRKNQHGGKTFLRKHFCGSAFLHFTVFEFKLLCYIKAVFSILFIAKCYEFMTYINTNRQVRLSSLKSFRLISINDTTILAVVNLIQQTIKASIYEKKKVIIQKMIISQLCDFHAVRIVLSVVAKLS